MERVLMKLCKEVFLTATNFSFSLRVNIFPSILGSTGAGSQDDGIFVGESLQLEQKSPWAAIYSNPLYELTHSPLNIPVNARVDTCPLYRF